VLRRSMLEWPIGAEGCFESQLCVGGVVSGECIYMRVKLWNAPIKTRLITWNNHGGIFLRSTAQR